MAILHVTSDQGRLRNPNDPFQNFDQSLLTAIRACPPDRPIVLMIHGYKYSPKTRSSCPHRTLYAEEINRADWNLRSWPAALDLTQCDNRNGLAIGYAWDASPSYRTCWRNLPDIYERARVEARVLAKLLTQISKISPNRKIHILAHSMGARLALLANRRVKKSIVDRLVILGGTEFWHIARKCTKGRPIQVFNIKAKQNRLYDVLFKTFGPKTAPGRDLLGEPRLGDLENWVNICVDDHQTCSALTRIGINISPAPRGFSHWGFYTRNGVFDLYRGIFEGDPNMSVKALKVSLRGSKGATDLPSGFDFFANTIVSTILPRKIRH